MAFYLKYRPRKITDIDLTEARETLTKILRADQSLPHAILLAGPRGIGKTSSARIIAKSLNCPNKKNGQIDPCDQCSSCLAIARGSFLDVLEIDAASNRGIDDIRQLKEGVSLAPVKGKKKIYIIDEVHMLTNEAFNALLKTLEEPPEKVVFILCTTNPEKIPETVLSRCLRINFQKANSQEVVRALKRVVEGENLAVEDDRALTIIAENVDGSFRDAQKILEELSLDGGKITVEGVNNLVGRKAALAPTRLLACLSENDFDRALEEIGRLENGNVDWSFYFGLLLGSLRELLHGVWSLPDGKKGQFSEDELIKLVEVFSWAAREVKISPLPVLVAEVAISRLFDDKKSSSPPGNDGQNLTDDGSLEEETPAKSTPSSKKAKAVEAETKIKSEVKTQPKRLKPAAKESPSREKAQNRSVTEEQWQELLEKIKPKNHSLEAFLKSAWPISFKDDQLTLGVSYQLHKECLEKETNRRIVEAVAGEVFDGKICLFYRLDKKPLLKKEPDLGKKRATEDNTFNTAKEIFGGDDNG